MNPGCGRPARPALSASTLFAAAALACAPPPPSQGEKAALGEDCLGRGPEGCLSNRCLVIDTGTAYCTQGCSGDPDCPGDYLCQVAGALGKSCVKRAGAVCEKDEQCPAGHRCDAQAKRCYIPVVRGLCGPCTSNLQCPENGGCQVVRATGEQFCTTPCDPEACPAGFACIDVGRARRQCIPNRQTCNAGRPLCSPCRGDAECGGAKDLCVRNVISGERFCGRDCTGGIGCPNGFACLDLSGTGLGPFQCVPNAQTCEGYCDASDPAAAETQCGLGRTCEVADNQCVGATDGRLCAPCVDDDDCREPGRCVVNRESGETFCGEDCSENPAACPGDTCRKKEDKCPAGFSCVAIGSGGTPTWPYQCVPTRGTCLSGVGRVGDDCPNGAADCLAGVCLEFGTAHICSAACGDDADCGDGRFRCCRFLPAEGETPARFDCTQAPASSGVCAPIGGGFGDDCAPGRPPCHSGLCLDIGTARLCTVGCDGEHLCPEGFRCAEGVVAGGAEKVSICFPDGGGALGSDCTFGPAACQSRLCIKKLSGNVCTASCEGDAGCPPDWSCVGTETVDQQSVQVCVPPGTRT